MENDDTDEISELVRKSAANAGAFKQLYEHLIDRVFAYIRYRTGTEDIATDLTQEVFVDLYRVLPTFRYTSKEQFYSFVFTITKRKLAKLYTSTQMRVSNNTVSFDDERYVESVPDRVLAADVVQALAVLDDTAREIVVLHHWSRYTFPEIATLMHMKESAVRVRHHRALKTLSVSLDSQ